MPSPSSTRGGSKGLALEGLAISTGQHWPQHKDMCAFLKGKEKKKFSDPLHKRSWSKDVLFQDVTEERHPSNVSSLACPQTGGTSFFLSHFTVYQSSGAVGASLQAALSSNSPE